MKFQRQLLFQAVLFLSGLVFVPAVSADGSFRFSIVGESSYSQYINTVPPDTTATDRRLGLGGGFLVEFPLSVDLGLETGAIYLVRRTETELARYGFPYVEVPLLLKYWFTRYTFLGAGGYGMIGAGDVQVTSGSSQSKLHYSQTSFKSTDYGLTASFGIALPLGASTSFLIDSRFNYGLANVYRPVDRAVTVNWNDVQILAGLSFGLNRR